jgi:hypothetical protein
LLNYNINVLKERLKESRELRQGNYSEVKFKAAFRLVILFLLLSC